MDAATPAEQAPLLRALSVSHSIARPGTSVSVTWCYEHCEDVIVDGRPGYAACGEALVPVDESRQVEVVGRNRYGSTPVATPAIVVITAPQLNLPTVAAPPPVSLRTDVTATVSAGTPITERLDDFWAAQDNLRPQLGGPAPLVGVPQSMIDSLRRMRRRDEESQ